MVHQIEKRIIRFTSIDKNIHYPYIYLNRNVIILFHINLDIFLLNQLIFI